VTAMAEQAAAMEVDEGEPAGDAPAAEGTPAFKRCLEAVRLDDTNYASWTLLLAEAEATSNPMLEEVYGRFLENFPPLYGYWAAYARTVHARVARGGDAVGAAKEGAAVFEKGVAATAGASVDLWVKYGEFMKDNNGADPAATRAVMDRACAAVAGDPRSALVFQVYEAFEEQQGDHAKVVQVARRALGCARATDADGSQGFPGRQEALERLTALAEAAPAGSLGGSADDLLCAVATESNAAARADREKAPFEQRLTRPYFHVKPLDEAQLRAWRAYLDWTEDRGDEAQTRALYERCLVACAAYPEFWARYALWDQARGLKILERGLNFVKSSPDLLLLRAQLLEAAGRVDDAREGLEEITEHAAPGLLEAVLAQARFERRRGSSEDVVAAYRSAMPKLESGSEAKSLVAVALARYQRACLRDCDAARGTLEQAIREAPAHRELWVAYYALEAETEGAGAHARVAALFQTAFGPDVQLAKEDQQALWDLYLAHVEDLSPDVNHVLKVRDEHAAWLRSVSN